MYTVLVTDYWKGLVLPSDVCTVICPPDFLNLQLTTTQIVALVLVGGKKLGVRQTDDRTTPKSTLVSILPAKWLN